MKNPSRAEYQRRYYHLKKAYWNLDADHPDYKLSWQEYLVKHAHSAKGKPRGPYKGVTQRTPRQEYQATYQRAYRAAKDYWNRTPKIHAQYADGLSGYWQATKHAYLPDGFFKEPRGQMVRKYKDGAKNDRSNYQTAYREYRRKWDADPQFMAEQHGTWARYWAWIKPQIFAQGGAKEEPIPDVVQFQSPDRPDLDGKELFMPLSMRPAPITRPTTPAFPKPAAVLLEGMDNPAANEDNDGWFAAA